MEYPDAIDEATFIRAIALTHALRSTHAGSVRHLAATAVLRTYCTCVTNGEDAAEHQFSPIHRQLIDDVAGTVRLAEREQARAAEAGE